MGHLHHHHQEEKSMVAPPNDKAVQIIDPPATCVVLLFQKHLKKFLLLDWITMWNWRSLPSDLLAIIFSYLPTEDLARAKAVCRSWRAAEVALPRRRLHLPWFLALSPRSWGLASYAYNPGGGIWHLLPLDHRVSSMRPIATVGGGHILLKRANTTGLQLAIWNPFTRELTHLPRLNVARINPALGIVEEANSNKSFSIYVAGGMSEGVSGGAVYQSTVEVYEPFSNAWRFVGAMPVEFAIRLTVWTPNESVHSNGVLYWMTSARAYSVMGYKVGDKTWTELRVPMADRLEFAGLFSRFGKLAVVGGRCGGDTCIWELGEDDQWDVVDTVPVELVRRLSGDESWESVKCVGLDGAVCLYRDLKTGLLVWQELVGEGKWEWVWIDSCCSIRGKEVQNLPFKGLLLHPNLAHSVYNG